MNGGALGAMHIDHAWGDPLLASLYGSNAVFWGGEPASLVFNSMGEDPERFTALDTTALARERGSCKEKCEALNNPISRLSCYANCQGVLPDMPGISSWVASFGLAALAVLLIAIGAYAFVN